MNYLENDTYVTFRKIALPVTLTLNAPDAGTNMAVGATVGKYDVPSIEFECAAECNQALSPMVFFGTRYAGAVCWGSRMIWIGMILLSGLVAMIL